MCTPRHHKGIDISMATHLGGGNVVGLRLESGWYWVVVVRPAASRSGGDDLVGSSELVTVVCR